LLANNSYLFGSGLLAVLVRPATKEDLPGLMRIEHECFGRERFSRRYLVSLLEDQEVDVLIGMVEGEVVASAMVLHDPSTIRSRILSLAIIPEEQGHGRSKPLLTHIEELARQRGSLMIFLEVRVGNEAAINLYLGRGYRIGDRIPDFFGREEDAWYMERALL
jgi:[ribosomal protein S18]-alanine N-acetyltransferase